MLRSFLFAPGDSTRKLEKSLTVGADAVIADLEDSIAPDGKETARRVTAEFLQAARGKAGRPRLFVRINGLATGLADDDLDGVMAAAPDGIVLPKAVGVGADFHGQVLAAPGNPVEAMAGARLGAEGEDAARRLGR